MSYLRFVTMTGVDTCTDMDTLVELSQEFKLAEWGVLYSPGRAGTEPRYPSLTWIENFATEALTAELNIALHLCGKSVTILLDALKSGTIGTGDAARIVRLAAFFGRVQLNVRAEAKDAFYFVQLIDLLSRTEQHTRVILQWNDHNADLCRQISRHNSLDVLVDSSGGRGQLPSTWPNPDKSEIRRIGFAGGLGPHNVEEQLAILGELTVDRTFWIDMEQSLRDSQDNFDLDRCAQVLQKAQSFVQYSYEQDGAIYGEGTQSVAELSGMWLDFWVGTALRLNMVVPPPDACRAMLHYIYTGSFESYAPSENAWLALRILSQEKIALTPTPSDYWQGQALAGGLPMQAEELHIAGLRAVVAKYFGDKVPLNPSEAVRL